MFAKRSKGIFIIILMAFLLLIGRLGWLMLVRGDALAARAQEQRLRSIELYQYQRGDILDRNMRSLTGQEAPCLVVFPTLIGDPQKAAQSLSEALEYYYDEGILTDKLSSASQSPYILQANLDAETAAAVQELAWPGIMVINLCPRYADPPLANHLLGFVGSATQEEAEALGLSAAGLLVGKTGLEKQYDQLLRDRSGPTVGIVVDERGQQTNDSLFLIGSDSQNNGGLLVLTLDRNYQQIAEAALEGYNGAVVVMDVQNGQVLAMASYPTYDPYLGQPADTDELNSYVNKALAAYPPASVFKLVLAAAALENGLDLPEDFICEGSYTLTNGHTVSCWKKDGHGEENMAEALANSCNCYFVWLGQELGGDAIQSYANRFGLRESQLIGYNLASTNVGLCFNSKVPADVANLSIGENGVRLTPVMVAQIISTIANGGYRVTPQLVLGTIAAGSETIQYLTAVEPERAISEKTATILQNMLAEAVKSGTAVNAASQIVTTAGKTGTTQYQGVWFAGFAPVDEPKWAVSVYVSNGTAGGKEGAAIFKEIVEKLAILEGISKK